MTCLLLDGRTRRKSHSKCASVCYCCPRSMHHAADPHFRPLPETILINWPCVMFKPFLLTEWWSGKGVVCLTTPPLPPLRLVFITRTDCPAKILSNTTHFAFIQDPSRKLPSVFRFYACKDFNKPSINPVSMRSILLCGLVKQYVLNSCKTL